MRERPAAEKYNREVMGLFSREPEKRVADPESPDLPLRKADLQALLEDMEAGAKYQQALLPQKAVPLPGYDLAWLSRPARILSGDFCDLFHFEPYRLGLVVADASGKSIPASLLAVMCHLLFRTRPEPAAPPARVLRHVNRQLLGNIKRGTFISAAYGVLDAERHRLTIANAGHLPVVMWHAREKVATPHRPRGSVLGVLPPAAYEHEIVEETIALAPGDRFVFLTDGVNEAMAPGQREFGMEHLRRRLKADSDGPSDEFLRSIMEEIEIHRGGGDQSDDITVVTGRRLP
jgi:sigma-B regulation protein RsbU (phosphoserine phosphatase)